MAIKRKRSDEDDEERPRRKRRADEDDDEEEGEEDEDRPSRRRRSRDDDDDDEEDDDRPAKRRRSRDDDEEDEEDDDRPAKRRRSRDDDDEEDEDRPRKRRKSRDDDDEDEDDKPPPPKIKDKSAKPGDKELDEDELAYQAYQKKKALHRKQMLAASAGLEAYDQRVKVFLLCLASIVVVGGMTGLFGFTMPDMLQIMEYVVYLVIAVLALAPTAMGIAAANKCKLGPPKIAESRNLRMEPILSGVTMACFGGAFVFWLLFDSPDDVELRIFGALTCIGLGFEAYVAVFINQLLYLKAVGKFLKDKVQAKRILATIQHFSIFCTIAPIILSVAAYFLHFMGMLGDAISGALHLVWAIAYVKGFMDTRRIIEGLRLAISKQLTAADKPNW